MMTKTVGGDDGGVSGVGGVDNDFEIGEYDISRKLAYFA